MASKYKVIIADNLDEESVLILNSDPEISVDFKKGISRTDLLDSIKDYDALIVRSRTTVDKELIDNAVNMKVIGRAGMGVDNIDTEHASEKGIVVMNTPDGNSVTTAEHTISMIMSISRNIPQACSSVKSGKWEKNRFVGIELYGKTLGLIGMGRIGSIVADRAIGLKMNLIVYDPYLSPDIAAAKNINLASLDEVIKNADIITIHVPLSESTENLINKERFAQMKDGVMIVNCARGKIVNEHDLIEAIKSKKVSRAALDVFEKEPIDHDNPILKLDEIVLTPHLGASTKDAIKRVSLNIASQVKDYLLTETITNAVNVPSISSKDFIKIKPYLKLAEDLGSFLSQITKGALLKFKLTFYGELIEIDTKPILQSFLKGLLKISLGKSVNYVNASILAKDRGIQVSSVNSPTKRNFTALLSAEVTTSLGRSSAEGILSFNNEPRIVKLNDYAMEAKIEGDMLVINSVDEAGAIGRIGTALGNAKINIASFQLGRLKDKKLAMSIVNIDSTPSQSDIEMISKLESVLDVQAVRL